MLLSDKIKNFIRATF